MAHHPETDLYRCKRCTHAFSHLEVMREFERYEDNYYDVEHRRWFDHPNTALFERIAKSIPPGASVLDVGCGRGDFLRYLTQTRPDLRLSGIDLSSNQSVDGIRFLQGDIMLTGIDECFDAIVSLAVIEHISGVTEFVQRIHDLINPGGIAIVMTLNEGSLLYGLARAGYHLGVPLVFNRLYSRHHLHHFTRKSFRTALRNGGFSIESDFVHAAPLAAIDLPVQGKVADAILRGGTWILFKAGAVTGRNYLQTIVGRARGPTYSCTTELSTTMPKR
jgi:2-polyprenyl-3-methyl-5-hydroxy-6-metoxy-1,4-benzoquinol methylase